MPTAGPGANRLIGSLQLTSASALLVSTDLARERFESAPLWRVFCVCYGANMHSHSKPRRPVPFSQRGSILAFADRARSLSQEELSNRDNYSFTYSGEKISQQPVLFQATFGLC